MNEIIVHQNYSSDMVDFMKNAGKIAASEVEPMIDDEVPHIVDEVWRRGPINAALKSASGASVVLDMSLPQDDVDGDEPLYRAPRIVHGVPSALKKTSGTKFIELLALVRKMFAGHDEEMSEVFEICEQARSDARSEAIAMAGR